jgi:pimeloyl-ACP methyl ester carboxylesterase
VPLRSLVGGAIFAEVSGEGWPLVVALHGWGRDRSDMAPATAGLPGTTVLVDLPGHGASPEPPEVWGSEDYAHRVGAAIDELQLELAGDEEVSAEEASQAPAGPTESTGPTVVVGHSLGGRVAVCLAARRPELVDGLVLAGVPLLRKPPGKPKPAFRVVRRLHRWHLVSDGHMETWRQRYGSADYVAAQGVMRQVLIRLVGESYETQLAQLECPVALVWGELDTAAPLTMARQAAGLIPTKHTLDVAEGVGHDVHTERPELLHTRIAELADT